MSVNYYCYWLVGEGLVGEGLVGIGFQGWSSRLRYAFF